MNDYKEIHKYYKEAFVNSKFDYSWDLKDSKVPNDPTESSIGFH